MDLTRNDWDNLPEQRLEVVDGRAVFHSGNMAWHQELSDNLVVEINRQTERLATSAVSVFVPVPPGGPGEIQSRVPDIVVASFSPDDWFRVGEPPEWVIEILETRAGNSERTAKMEDYARAGINEYWLVNPEDRLVEVYALENGSYQLRAATTKPRSLSFPSVEVVMGELWAI